MTRHQIIRSTLLLIGSLTLMSLSGCQREVVQTQKGSGFEEFIPIYNRYIQTWLKEQLAISDDALESTRDKLTNAKGEEAERLQLQFNALKRDEEKWQYRIALGDYLRFSDPGQIPTNLVWQQGLDQPEIGDPAAKKGGAFRCYMDSFPPTIRPFGSNSNNSFRGDLYDYIEMTLVTLHPETMEMIPGLAKEWAVSEDGRTTYFRLHKEARYSDGVPIKARDYLFDCYLRVSDNVTNPYAKQYFRENVAQITCYDDHTLSVSLPEAKLYAPAIAGALNPSPPHFYQEYGPDYDDRYQWRFPPTTGAYEVHEEDIIKGVSITQTRVKDWWAKDLKYYRHRFNADKIIHTVVRDESKAFELFRAGQLDTLLLNLPELWYEKSEMDPIYKGYIERTTFYNRYPKIPRGLYLNVIKEPLDNRDVRVGVAYSMNWQKVIDLMFRGDAQILNFFNEGYGKFSDPNLRARGYSINQARQSFAAAGYTEEGSDGILKKTDGNRLSIALSYPGMPFYDKMLAILKEEAKACGLELRLDGLERTVSYKKTMQKQHQMTLSGWMVQPPTPDFYEFLHSSNAFDDKGNPKPQTNNIFSWSRPDTDKLCDLTRSAHTEEELSEASWKLQNIMHDEAIFLPGFSVDFTRMGSWRWVRWPDCETTRFSPPVVYDPREVYVYWIDEHIQRETQEARRSGKAFAESNRTIDIYRERPATKADAAPPIRTAPELPETAKPESP